VFGNRRRTIQCGEDAVSERVGRANGGDRATVRDRSSRVVSPGARAHMTRVDGLNHVLRVRTVVRSDDGWGFWSLCGENGGRKGKRMKISAFGDGGILKDDQEAGIIDPFDLKSSTDAFPLCKSGLDVPRLEFFWESGERKNACDASRELGE